VVVAVVGVVVVVVVGVGVAAVVVAAVMNIPEEVSAKFINKELS